MGAILHRMPSVRLLARIVAYGVALVLLQPRLTCFRANAQGTSTSKPFPDAGAPQQTVWQFASADVNYRINGHRQVVGESRSGRPSEWVAVTAGPGSFLHISRAIDRCRVVNELKLSLSLKATRPGLQILARVVLPGAVDESTGKPRFTLVRGATYKQAGVWQELRLENFPQLVERQMRVLRAQYGPQIESRGAYVDFVGLNIFGGQGETQVWIDDLQVTGAVSPDAVAVASQALAATRAERTQDGDPTHLTSPEPARLSGSVLNVAGRPMFPRVIEHQGEPLTFLAGLGFNAIRVREPPSDALLAEAEQSGLWIVAPPPLLEPRLTGNGPHGKEEIAAKYDRVLVWSLGQELSTRDFDRVAALAADLKRADRRRARPLLCAPETDLLQYSREVRDLLSIYRFPLSTTLELADYGTWLRERTRLARPGTPFWTVIQTQAPAATRSQLAALGGGVASGVDSDALRLLVYTSVGSGARGLEFASHSRLDARDDETRMRALTLAILNAELDLLEPWAAAGNYVATADSNDPEVKGVLLQYESSRLLLVTRAGARDQYLPNHRTASSLSFVLPGVPESHELVELSAAGARPLKHKRVTGGTLITLDQFDLVALVLITPESLMANALSRRLAGIAGRTTELERELAALTFAQVEALERRLPPDVRETTSAAEPLALARRSLDESARALAGGDRRAAHISAGRAIATLGRLRRQIWDRAAATVTSPAASPLLAHLTAVPAHWQLVQMLRAASVETNRLPAGDFESVQALVDSSWRHVIHPIQGIDTSVEIAPGGTASGRSCLRLEVRPKESTGGDVLLETAPVWISTPPVPVRRGELLRIAGRVRVPAAVRGSVDGLMIIDSLGGDGLAERIGQTKGWQDFVLYRAAPSDGAVTVTFSLTGFGEALVDDVTICPLRLGGGRSDAPAQRAEPNTLLNPAHMEQAQRSRQIFAPPRR